MTKNRFTALMAALLCMLYWRWAAAEGQEDTRAFRYRYVSIDSALPTGFDFFAEPINIINNGNVYLNAWTCTESSCAPSIASYRNGTATILHQNAQSISVNNHGVIGGSVVLDPVLFIEQAALFDRGTVTRIPRMQGEFTSQVIRITDSCIALVRWFDASFEQEHYYLYQNGRVTLLDFGGRQAAFLDVNNKGIVAGSLSDEAGVERAFRLNPFSGQLTLLPPLPTEPMSRGQAINNASEVLGYSFVPGALERIGVWRGKYFLTYFVEGTPQFPTVSNRLLWNNAGLIIITRTSSSDMYSYLVPRPGTRLNLADLADTLPRWTLISDINERGDIVGVGGSSYFNIENTFLLERVRDGR
ncbi:hypothetical protein [Corallococcus llansteffanensis]|uniref:Uncharacterized protein n=1 Tax=Corallococcus llansteffanensis TaxID=2316731 RepID=A0A3A8Q2G2_9BACT|nr:hypothetical protein [Corallococcus llansteffanensis]RKH62946.1 hypothetical protein D7V93_09390 [Corallococcus llansteffanensis]